MESNVTRNEAQAALAASQEVSAKTRNRDLAPAWFHIATSALFGLTEATLIWHHLAVALALLVAYCLLLVAFRRHLRPNGVRYSMRQPNPQSATRTRRQMSSAVLPILVFIPVWFVPSHPLWPGLVAGVALAAAQFFIMRNSEDWGLA